MSSYTPTVTKANHVLKQTDNQQQLLHAIISRHHGEVLPRSAYNNLRPVYSVNEADHVSPGYGRCRAHSAISSPACALLSVRQSSYSPITSNVINGRLKQPLIRCMNAAESVVKHAMWATREARDSRSDAKLLVTLLVGILPAFTRTTSEMLVDLILPMLNWMPAFELRPALDLWSTIRRLPQHSEFIFIL